MAVAARAQALMRLDPTLNTAGNGRRSNNDTDDDDGVVEDDDDTDEDDIAEVEDNRPWPKVFHYDPNSIFFLNMNSSPDPQARSVGRLEAGDEVLGLSK